MRIVSGTARGIELSVSKGLSVRPTSIRARKALFDSLGPLSGDMNAADLFAGSGAIGLEAASRGAGSVSFIENLPAHCAVIQENILKVKKAGVGAEFKVVQADASSLPLSLLFSLPSPDIIFADPPYAESGELFNSIKNSIHFAKWGKKAILIWELPERKSMDFMDTGLWKREKMRKFGSTEFLFMVRD